MEAVFKASILILIWLCNIGIMILIISKVRQIKDDREFAKKMMQQIDDMRRDNHGKKK